MACPLTVWDAKKEPWNLFSISVVEIPGLRYFGPQGVRDRVGVFSVQMDGFTPHQLAKVLESRYGILTRPGIHCAPLAHEALCAIPGKLLSGALGRGYPRAMRNGLHG